MSMKAAVIGAGRISRQHITCLNKLPAVEVVGICDLSSVLAEAAADRYKIGGWYTDYRRMLDEVRPDVVHVTTPPRSHFAIAMDVIGAGAHVIIEKPVTVARQELTSLLDRATETNRNVVEDYNYLFNRQVREIQALIADGTFGEVTHVEVTIALPIFSKGSVFTDPNVPNDFTTMTGGAIADFLPHLASLANMFIGEHRAVRTIWQKRSSDHAFPSDEFRALVDGERATAHLSFSAHTQPDTFQLRVLGTKMTAVANLFDTRLTLDRLRGGPKPLVPMLNGLDEARRVRRGAYGGLWRKLSAGPGVYEGLWELLRQTYAALETGRPLPVTHRQIQAVNRLVDDMTSQGTQL
jgi:predicted dehydrogenase